MHCLQRNVLVVLNVWEHNKQGCCCSSEWVLFAKLKSDILLLSLCVPALGTGEFSLLAKLTGESQWSKSLFIDFLVVSLDKMNLEEDTDPERDSEDFDRMLECNFLVHGFISYAMFSIDIELCNFSWFCLRDCNWVSLFSMISKNFLFCSWRSWFSTFRSCKSAERFCFSSSLAKIWIS
mgnify:CR=1 FL=1